MSLAPYKRGIGESLTSDVTGVEVLRAFLAHFQVSAANAIALGAANVLAATPLTAAVQAIVAGITNPRVPRNVSIVGNAAGIAGNVTVKGLNYAGVAISEVLALNGTTPVVGAKAFASFTEIDLPIQTHAGTDTVSVGLGSKLGLPYLLPHNTVLAAYLNNVKEATAPTVTTDAANIENNTMLLNSALNGSAVDAYLLV
jgi:hypothetical protein